MRGATGIPWSAVGLMGAPLVDCARAEPRSVEAESACEETVRVPSGGAIKPAMSKVSWPPGLVFFRTQAQSWSVNYVCALVLKAFYQKGVSRSRDDILLCSWRPNRRYRQQSPGRTVSRPGKTSREAT